VDRDTLIGGSAAAAVVAIAMVLVIFIFVRRQWSHSEERKLRLRAHLSGLAFGDDEVALRLVRLDTAIKSGVSRYLQLRCFQGRTGPPPGYLAFVMWAG